uniref:Aa_trans domain-containing protein n=2 Tax=Mesocestoides corti TaxID=53468 RepID=A0A5K3FZ76_MESCO
MPLEHRETRDWLRPGGPTCLRPNPTPHHITMVHRYASAANESDCETAVELLEPLGDNSVEFTNKSTSSGAALVNFLKGNIGTGILALPIAFKHSGIWLGSFLLLFYAFLSTYLMHVLLRTVEIVIVKHNLDRSKVDYAEAVFNIFKYGPECLKKYKGKAKHTINAFLLLTQLGFCCLYVLFVSQNIKYFMESTWPGSYSNLNLIGFVVILLIVMLNIKISIRILSIPSAVAMVSTIAGLTLIFIYLFTSGLGDPSTLPSHTSFHEVCIALGIFIFTFEGVALALPIRNHMHCPDEFVATFGVLNASMVITACLCLMIGFFGYLCFGNDILSSITYNIPSTVVYIAVKPLFVLAIILSYLLQFYVPAVIFGRLMLKMRWHRMSSPEQQSINRKIMRVVLILFTYAVAMLVPHLDLMLSLLGSVSSSALSLLVPPVVELIHLWPDRQQISHFYLTVVTKNALLLLVGLFSAICGTAATVIQIITVLRNGGE